MHAREFAIRTSNDLETFSLMYFSFLVCSILASWTKCVRCGILYKVLTFIAFHVRKINMNKLKTFLQISKPNFWHLKNGFSHRQNSAELSKLCWSSNSIKIFRWWNLGILFMVCQIWYSADSSRLAMVFLGRILMMPMESCWWWIVCGWILRTVNCWMLMLFWLCLNSRNCLLMVEFSFWSALQWLNSCGDL